MKFSIRDLLLVTMIVVLGLGWWLDHRRQATEVELQWHLQTNRTSTLFRVVPASNLPNP